MQTRRLQLTVESGFSAGDSLAALVHTLSSYGIIEDVQATGEEGPYVKRLAIQFQRLSAAEQLVRDGALRRVDYAPPVSCVSAALLLSSSQAFPTTWATDLAAMAAGGAWEEKLLAVPQGLHAPATLSTSGGDRPSGGFMAAMWSRFNQAVGAVTQRVAGPFVGLLRFSNAEQAFQFLSAHQRRLSAPDSEAQRSGVVAVYAGGDLLTAASRLLRRYDAEQIQVGAVLRGVVLRRDTPPGQQSAWVVDAGVRATGSLEQTVLLRANFHGGTALRVGSGDEVELTVTGIQRGRSRSASTTTTHWWTGTIAQVVRAAEGPGGRGVVDMIRRALNAVPPAPPAAPASGGVTRSLADQLLKKVQARAQGSGSAATPAERLAPYSAPFHIYASLLVAVERAEDCGIHAKLISVDDVAAASSSPPEVFIPASCIPEWGDAETRHTFAVAGGRITCALLYLVSVGESSVTRRCIASRLEADVSRCRRSGLEGGGGAQTLEVGMRVEGTTSLQLTPEATVGIPARTPYFPAYLIRPGAQAPPAAYQLPLVLPLSEMTPDAALSRSTLITLVVAEICNGVEGHYAVVVSPEAFKARQEATELKRNETAMRQKEEENKGLMEMRMLVAAACRATEEGEGGPTTKKTRLES